MRSVLRIARSLAGVILALAIVVTASGWLYVARPYATWPGPRVADALPLDELSRRAGTPLLLFLVVWCVAALLLGLVARWTRTERLTAGLLLGLGVGAFAYVETAASILIVRQVPAHQALDAAAWREAVFVPAALAALGGALLGRPARTAPRRWSIVLATLVGLVGALGIVDASLPVHRSALIGAFEPAAVHGLSKSLVAPLGLGLLVAARGLARRQRRAWQIALALLTALAVLQVGHRFTSGAALAALAVVALLARRSDFTLRGDPSVKPRIAFHAALFAALIAVYGFGALWVNRLMADQPYTFGFALRETTRAVVGLSLRSSKHLSGAVAQWYPDSVFFLGLLAVAVLLFEWLRPWRYRLRQEARERELVRRLVHSWGEDTLAPFALRADKSYFFSASERAFVAYRVVGGVAIVSGDPVGPADERAELLGRFIEFAHERGWRIAVLGASEAALDVYRRHGMHALYHGDEAVIDTSSFSLDGRPIRKVRQSVHRLHRAGYASRVLRPSEIDDELRGELETIARVWRGSDPERGFAMALDALFGLGDGDALFVVGFDADGRARGFLHFAVSPACSALSLSSMPRLRDTPNGFNEWLVCETVAWARANAYARVSLNFAPFAGLLAPEAKLTRTQRVQAAALRSLKGHFQLDNLLLFNRKFFPRWERRFVVYERRLDLPRVGIAALAAEAYLPFQGRRVPA